MPKISVLIPIYNVENYLRECLDSVVNQTLQDIEIICINDGSTDSSLEIIQEYAQNDNRIKIIDKQNSGYGASLNKGLEMACGEYIGIIESDDFARHEMFEELYNFAKEYQTDIVKGDFYHYYTSSDLNKRVNAIPQNCANRVVSPQSNPEILEIYPSIWSGIYKRKFINENNIRFLESPGASYQDTSFAFKTFALAKRVYLTTKAYIYYRQDNVNSSINAKNKVFLLCPEYDEIERFIDHCPDIQDFAFEELCIVQYKGYKWTTMRVAENYRKEFVDMFSSTFKRHLENGYLGKSFYKFVKKSDFNNLINKKDVYLEKINKKSRKEEQKLKRNNQFKIRINPRNIIIILFGKKIVYWERNS